MLDWWTVEGMVTGTWIDCVSCILAFAEEFGEFCEYLDPLNQNEVQNEGKYIDDGLKQTIFPFPFSVPLFSSSLSSSESFIRTDISKQKA